MKVKKIENLVGIALDVNVKDFEKVQKYFPEKLKVVDEDGNDKFAVTGCKGSYCGSRMGELNDYSAAFIAVGNKFLIWMAVPEDALKDTKKWVVDNYGFALKYLGTVEQQIAEAVKDAEAEIASISDAIDELSL